MEKTWKLLEGENIILRKPEPEDLEFLYSIENNSDFWFVSDTKSPYSRWQIRQHIENSIYDIYTNKELRLIIESKNNKTQLGIIDLFEFDPFNLRAGIGIIICKEFQKTNIATEAIKMIIEYSFSILGLNQLWCNIDCNNSSSINLFSKKLGFELNGTLKFWKKIENKFNDVYFYQLFKNKTISS